VNLFFGFSGRIGRGMWWLCQAVVFVIVVTTLVYLKKVYGLEFRGAATRAQMGAIIAENPGELLLTFVLGIGLSFWISLASTVKRFHDRDKSGFWFLINFIPWHIGHIWIAVECGILSGTPGTNSYGVPGGAVAPESASSGLDGEVVRADLVALERPLKGADRLAALSRTPGMGYAMREEAQVVRKASVPQQPAPGFGRRNSFR